MYTIIRGVLAMAGRNSFEDGLRPVLEGILICDPVIRDILRTRPMEMRIWTDLQERTSKVVTIYDELVPLSQATLDAITAVARGPAADDRKRYGTCDGYVTMAQVKEPASVYAVTYPERRRRAMAQIEAAAAHLRAIGRKRPAKALLKQARATWGREA